MIMMDTRFCSKVARSMMRCMARPISAPSAMAVGSASR
ncbi:Uncharacterised protein [Bordetella pertussis]|nr:Uncharacterised protein [Bordetella pertussis]CFP62032.1 Uncharacterised protein [Bordetella pertussis]CFU08126.1 Uncharacterised protein [Bordetella pertussis]CFW00343.1 Uncharacterised protein [Bordetella pertussis]CFW61598.1 Uncharacterised protein [Bordetella pertussis]